MASYLRPRRGSYNNAKAQLTASNPLKSGEVFFECENIGKSQGKIKLGDATTTYSSLPYFLSMQDSSIGFTDSTSSVSTAESTILGNIKPNGTHSSVITNIKQLLWNHSKKIAVHYGLIEESINAISTINSRVTTLENNHIGWDWLAQGTLNISATDFTLLYSRKLTDYDLLFLTCHDTGQNSFRSVTFPRGWFDGSADTISKQVEIDYANTSTMRWMCINYISNTKIRVVSYTNDSEFQLIGIKLK